MWHFGSTTAPLDADSQSSDERLLGTKQVKKAQDQAVDEERRVMELIEEMSFWNLRGNGTKDVKESRHDGERSRSETNASIEANSTKGPRSLESRSDHGKDLDPKETARKESVWKTAVDPATGMTYYYDSITRITQWEKPEELRALERQRKEERSRIDRAFFKEMEGNILKSLEKGELIPGIPSDFSRDTNVHVGPPREPSSPPSENHDFANGEKEASPSGRVRTISAMDEVLLAEIHRESSCQVHSESRYSDEPPQRHCEYPLAKLGRPPLPTGSSKRNVSEEEEDPCDMELSPDPIEKKTHPFHRDGLSILQCIDSPALTHEDALAGESFLDEPIQDEIALIAEIAAVAPDSQIPKVQHIRRNTGGTIYLQNTIYNPDIQATITCVCGVYRAHVVQASEHDIPNSSLPRDGLTDSEASDSWNVDVFRDRHSNSGRTHATPSLSEILTFYQQFYSRSRMEQDTIIMSLIYVERLVKATNGVLAPSPHNWRSILFACMVLASKVWDDLSMWNIDFSNVSAVTAGLAAFTLTRINQLELALLKALNFDVRVPAGEYAKYYFLIRTMLLRSGLMEENSKPLQRQKEHDASFSHLETLTTQYQHNMLPKPTSKVYSNTKASLSRPEPVRFRVQSLDGVMSFLHSKNKTGPVLRDTVCLEQLVG